MDDHFDFNEVLSTVFKAEKTFEKHNKHSFKKSEQNIIFCVDILIGPMGHSNKTEQNIALNFDLKKRFFVVNKVNDYLLS